MKRSTTALAVFLLAVGLMSPTASGGDRRGGVHIRIGGRYLELGISTTAPIIVYDNVYYQQTVETTSMLVPVTRDVPQTTAVMVPPNTTEILINGVAYPLEPEPVPRTIEVMTGTVQKTIYEPQMVETTVYVPTNRTTVTGAVYFAPHTVKSSWYQIGGVTVVEGKRHPRYKECKPPSGVVVVNGVWRYRDGTRVEPLRSVPTRKPVTVKPSHRPGRTEPDKTRRKRLWW